MQAKLRSRLLIVALGAALGAQSPAGDGAGPRRAAAIDPAGVTGARVVAGGGKLPDAVYARFLELAGGADAKVVVVPTASARADTEEGREATLQRWRDAHPGVAFSLLHTRDRAEADSEAFCAPLRAATGLWFGGGDQQKLADAYVGTRFEREVHELLARGGVVGGSSAGAAIQSRTMIARGKEPPVLATGLDLVPLGIVDQHFLKRDRLPRLRRALALAPGRFGLGVDEGTAAILRGRSLEVLGESKALLVLPAAGGKAERIVELASGDRVDAVTFQRAARQRGAGPWPPAALPTPKVPSGAVLLGGGGQLPDAVFARFLELAGGDAARVVIVPSASQRRPRRGPSAVERRLRALGCDDVRVVHPEHPSEVTAAHLAAIDEATGVWFGGGRQWRLVDAFEGTGAVDAFRGVLARGGVVGGSSAGATIQGEFLVRGNPLGNRDMWCEGYDRGFAFLPGCGVDQHFVARDRLKDLQGVIDAAPQVLGIGVDEGTAAVVTGSTLEVVGASKVAVVDARRRDGDGPIPPVWLAPGERWDLAVSERR